MRGTLVFVHGTGVRKDGYEATWAAVKGGARRNGITGISLVGCAWGWELRASFDDISDAFPEEVTTKDVSAAPALSEADIATATWVLLVEDPLFELRLAAEETPAESGVSVDILRPDQAAVEMLTRLQAASVDLSSTGLRRVDVVEAAAAVKQAPELQRAAQAAGSAADPDLIDGVARAVVASVLARHRLDPPGTAPAVAMNGAVRDALVEEITDVIAPAATKGVMSNWVKNKAREFAARKATALMLDRRQGLTGGSIPALGDILFYQRRGEEIRDFVAQRLRGLTHPVVAVGHSLGGIILVDLLSRDSTLADLLVTAGSQSPLFFLIDALDCLRPGQRGPNPFTPWLNIYNRYDFLSFCAERVFTGVPDIWDEPVDPGVGFPAAHSAYWHDDRVFEVIRARWPEDWR